MVNTRFDILGIGNAIVDQLAHVPESFLSRHDLQKGTMRLSDARTAQDLAAALPDREEAGGGSAANTCVIAATLGSRVAFLGKVAADSEGERFRADLTAAGVHCPTPSLVGGAPTARCVVAVTPDGARTMTTFLGASVAFGPDDVDPELIAASEVVYLEGYLFDPPAAQAAFHRAAEIARAAHRKVALSLSDPLCVDRHRAAFRRFVADAVDLLFANEAEVCSLYEKNDFAAAAAQAAGDVALAVLTRSEAGSVIVAGDRTIPIKAAPTTVVDTTGAGDAYAAGFLHAYTAGRDLALAGREASLAAGAVIAHLGARPAPGVIAGALLALG